MASVLVLGAGRVTGPLFEYLNKHGITFSVVCVVEKELETVKGKYPSVQTHCLDVLDPHLPALIAQHKVIVNLFPCTLLPQVSKICVEQQRPMVSASYISPEVQQLHQSAVEAGVLLLCECGLDPGIDHMLAMEAIDDAVGRGGMVTSFTSWCGGLPAPECRNNPLQYKFSWCPRLALLDLIDGVCYFKNGQYVKIPGSDTLRSARPVDTNLLPTDVHLEGYPNNLYDHHIKAYGLQSAEYIFRGTLRYQGFSDTVQGLIQAGLFSQATLPQLQPEFPDITWKSLVSCLTTGQEKSDDWEGQLLTKLGNSQSGMDALRGLGLLSDNIVEKKSTPFDTLAAFLEKHLAYAPKERDMTVMQHEIVVKFLDQQSTETTRIGLCVYGDPDGYTAMAKTVGYPVGMAVEMILKGEIQQIGVTLPTSAEIYKPMLSKLQELGICAQVYTEKA